MYKPFGGGTTVDDFTLMTRKAMQDFLPLDYIHTTPASGDQVQRIVRVDNKLGATVSVPEYLLTNLQRACLGFLEHYALHIFMDRMRVKPCCHPPVIIMSVTLLIMFSGHQCIDGSTFCDEEMATNLQPQR